MRHYNTPLIQVKDFDCEVIVISDHESKPRPPVLNTTIINLPRDKDDEKVDEGTRKAKAPKEKKEEETGTWGYHSIHLQNIEHPSRLYTIHPSYPVFSIKRRSGAGHITAKC